MSGGISLEKKNNKQLTEKKKKKIQKECISNWDFPEQILDMDTRWLANLKNNHLLCQSKNLQHFKVKFEDIST